MEIMKDKIFDDVKNLIVQTVKENDANKIKLDSKLASELGMDSLTSIELINGLEDKFDIQIAERNLASLSTVGDVVNFVQAKLRISEPVGSKNQEPRFWDSLEIDKSLAKNFNPYYQTIDSGLGRFIKIGNKKLLSLGSNDYLALSNNKAIKKAAINTIKKYGMSMCGTPIVIGQTRINRGLEKKISGFLKQDDCLLYPSGYQANMAVFQTLTNENDIILADKDIHSSLINGANLSGANLKFFPHNDTNTLQAMLADSLKYRMRFIVVEGLYSTEGDIARLDKIVTLAKEYASFTVIDDAHGIGVLGEEGRGILEKFNAYSDVNLITGSLGKALGLSGGFLAGNNKLIDYLRYRSPMYFYSTALPAHIAASAMAAIDLVRTHNDLRLKIFKYKERLFSALKDAGYHLTKSETPLFSILFKDSAETIKMTWLLFKRNIYVVPFIAPSVPKDSPRIRILASAYLKDKDIEKIISIFKELRSEYKYEQ